MRAFFCLELEPQLQQELDRITQILRRLRLRVSWVKRENLHVTVKFLGEVSEMLVAKLEAASRQALRESGTPAAVEWELDRVGAFPSIERPRVVWVGCSTEPETLARIVSLLQEKLAPLGFKPERERFVTHVTLGRVKEEGPETRALTQALQTLRPFRYKASSRALTLMESQLAPQGSIYKPIFRLPFSE